MLAVGAVAERGRLGPLLFFVFVWTTIVYDPIACWTWNPNGWVNRRGGLDFAGGTPVHISSGTAGLAISIYLGGTGLISQRWHCSISDSSRGFCLLGKRRGYGTERLAYKPHNTTYVVLGTIFLWFGWFGFNGGSELSANLRSAMACVVTNVSFHAITLDLVLKSGGKLSNTVGG
jgi:ammonium transporter, Amt family